MTEDATFKNFRRNSNQCLKICKTEHGAMTVKMCTMIGDCDCKDLVCCQEGEHQHDAQCIQLRGGR